MNKIKHIQCLFALLFLFIFPIHLCAQTTPVTINMQDATLKRIIGEIEKQTTYLFLSDETVDLTMLITVNVKNSPLKEVLDQIVLNYSLKYTITGSNIILSGTSKSAEQPVDISGVVSDTNNKPIVGASVIVTGTSTGTSTGTDGSFRLRVQNPTNAVLQFSFLGYNTTSLRIGTRTEFKVVLTEAAQEVESVVVTALGIKRSEKALSYNV